MKRKLTLAMVLLAMLNLAEGVPPRNPTAVGERYVAYQCDLDRDGHLETVGMVCSSIDSESGDYFGRLTVWESDGKTVLWQSPLVKDPDSEWAFGGWNFGVSNLEMVGDLDGDGAVEAVIPAPQSDVRPAVFQVYRWNGQAFESLIKLSLQEEPLNSGHYPWGKPDLNYYQRKHPVRWVTQMEAFNAQGLLVSIYEYRPGGMKMGQAYLAPDGKGFHVVRWTSPLRTP